jgi:hypothetical protein
MVNQDHPHQRPNCDCQHIHTPPTKFKKLVSRQDAKAQRFRKMLPGGICFAFHGPRETLNTTTEMIADGFTEGNEGNQELRYLCGLLFK